MKMLFINGLGECMRLILNNGTTGAACKKLNRNFIGIELDEEYFNVAKQRIGLVHPVTEE